MFFALSKTFHFQILFWVCLPVFDLASDLLKQLPSAQLLSTTEYIAFILSHSHCYSWCSRQMILQVLQQNKSKRCKWTASRAIQSPYWLKPQGHRVIVMKTERKWVSLFVGWFVLNLFILVFLIHFPWCYWFLFSNYFVSENWTAKRMFFAFKANIEKELPF